MGIDFGVARSNAEWHTEPNYRGTYGLLSSCLITMALCVWTTVHLNLPEHKKAKTQMWRKAWWLVIGLFAPELVVWTAFEQNREAGALCQKMRMALGEETSRSILVRIWSWIRYVSLSGRRTSSQDPEVNHKLGTSNSERHPWTMTHSHYAIMGGFAFDTSAMKPKFLPDERERVTLTSLGILRLATVAPHLLPNLSISQISDKSKANNLAKTIVFLQASWFIAQCISRMAGHLSVSLLELTTFAHAVCAILAYFLWWDKPFDVEEPTLIEGQDLAVVCAGMYMRSSIGTNCIGAGFFLDSLIVARIWHEGDGYTTGTSRVEFGLIESLIAHVPPARPVYAEITSGGEESLSLSASKERPTNPPVLAGKRATRVSQLDITEQHRRLYIGQSIFGFGFRRGGYHHFSAPPFRSKSLGRAFTQPTKTISSIAAEQGILSFQRPFIELTSADMLRLQLAKECYQKYPAFIYNQERKNYEKSYLAHPNRNHQIWLNEYIVSRVQNWPDSERSCQDSDINGLTVFVSLLVIGAAYGGLHLLAWNPPISSHTQILLWRISGMTLAISAIVPIAGLYTMVACFIMYEKLEKTTARKDMASKVPKWISTIAVKVMFVIGLIMALLFYVVTIGGGLLYVFSRVYLLIECVISIPYLPDTVFQTTNWSQYFPHTW